MYGFSDELDAKYFYHTFSLLFYKRVMAMTAKTSAFVTKKLSQSANKKMSQF